MAVNIVFTDELEENSLKVIENVNEKVTLIMSYRDEVVGVFPFECESDVDQFIEELLAIKNQVYSDGEGL